jgi:cell division protein FtsA
MKRPPVVTAVDLGTTKTCVIIAQIEESGRLDVKGTGECETFGMEKGIVKDIRRTAESIKKAIQAAEEASQLRAENIFVGVSGEHIRSKNANSRLSISDQIRSEPGEITQEDVDQVIKTAVELVITQEGDKNQQIIHAIPQFFEVDNQSNVFDPVNMSGYILTAHVHVILADVNYLKNINKCFELNGYKIHKTVLQSLASSRATLTEDEKSMGSIVIDIGGGTTDIAAYFKNCIMLSTVRTMGGINITSDISLGLSTPPKAAEKLKLQFGDVVYEDIEDREIIEVQGIGGRDPQQKKLRYLIRIIESRTREILELSYKAITGVHYHECMAAGVVLTGGSAQIHNLAQLTEEVFNMPVRVGLPDMSLIKEPIENMRSPRHSTSIGLLYFALDSYREKLISNKEVFTNKEAEKPLQKFIKSLYESIADFFS